MSTQFSRGLFAHPESKDQARLAMDVFRFFFVLDPADFQGEKVSIGDGEVWFSLSRIEIESANGASVDIKVWRDEHGSTWVYPFSQWPPDVLYFFTG